MIPLEAAADAAALALAGASAAGTLRLRARWRTERLTAALARERAAATLAALRRLGLAAERSVDDARAELLLGLREIAPVLDAALVFEPADDGALRCVAADGTRVAYFAGTRLARDDEAALPVRALVRGHRVTLADGGRGFHPADAFAVAIPLVAEREPLAVVYAAAPVALADDLCDALVAFADQAAVAYRWARERERDRARAEYDGLTGLLAPRALRERLAGLLARGRHDPRVRAALLFVDTDRFKSYNDAFGHPAGDALLGRIADLLRAARRSEDDLAARNGGDEFCLAFADCEKSEALRRAEQLRAAVAALGHVSASIGVAAFPADADEPNALLQAADEAMYHCKRSGRNGVAYRDLAGGLIRLDAVSRAV